MTAPILWPPDEKNWLIWKDSDAGRLNWLSEGGEGDDRGWDGWMASPTWWTWVWVSSRSWWWTGKPGVLQCMRSQRVGHGWTTELNWWQLYFQFLMLCMFWWVVFFLRNFSISSEFSTYWQKVMCNVHFLFNVCRLYSDSSFLIFAVATAAAKSLHSCPTLCDSIDNSPPGSPVPGILQARTLEWVAISFSNAWKCIEWKWKWSRSVVSDSAAQWTAAYQAPPSMGFSKQEYWSGVPLPSL